jgi:hypothetical protein
VTKAALRDRARIVLWGIAIIGAAQAAALYLAQNHTGAVIAQLVIAEFGTGRLGVAWSDPLAPIPSGAAIARRALRGASLGAAAAVILLGVSVLLRVAILEAGTIGIAPIVVGLVLSACIAARDELLLRGLVLRALGPQVNAAVRLGVCGLAGAAFRFGTDASATKTSLAFALLSSMALAALWLRDRGAWLAVSANATFVFLTGPLAHGALLDLGFPQNAQSARHVDLDGSLGAVACALVFAASAIAWARKQESSTMPS